MAAARCHLNNQCPSRKPSCSSRSGLQVPLSLHGADAKNSPLLARNCAESNATFALIQRMPHEPIRECRRAKLGRPLFTRH